MLVYSGSISKFNYDIDTGSIERRIKEELERHGISHNNLAEERAWRYSLLFMKNVLSDNEIDEDTKIAIEYKIPTTSKRVDFLISGKDENDKSNLIVIELKQWESAYKTEKNILLKLLLAKLIVSLRTLLIKLIHMLKQLRTLVNMCKMKELE